MANYCGRCGSKLNPQNGLCPKCDKKEVAREKLRFAVAGILIAAAASIVYFTFFAKPLEIRHQSDPPAYVQETDSEDSIEIDTSNNRKLVRIERYQDNGGMDRSYELSYNEDGNINNVIIWSYDEDGQQVFDNTYPIEYDAEGRVIRNGIIGMGSYSEYEYDDAGLLVHSMEAEGGAVNTDYEYDERGRLIQSLTQGEGVDTIVTYRYDYEDKILARIERNEYHDGTVEESTYLYNYNQKKQLSSIESDTSETRYEYDAEGRISKIVFADDTSSTVKRYQYDCKPFVICTETWTLKENNQTFSFGTAEIQDVMDHTIFSIHIGQGSAETDDEGYLTWIKSAADDVIIQFLYEGNTEN